MKRVAPIPTLARMVLTTRDANLDQPIFYADAIQLFKEGHIDLLTGTYAGMACFMMPRSVEEILANKLPPFSKRVKEAIERARKAGACL